ncbi:MAG TPA: tetratricopeptide repeat protein [Bacteroidia bacterium]|nr:tetratricopeptide repeat protein [Bacteroidia bacterium]
MCKIKTSVKYLQLLFVAGLIASTSAGQDHKIDSLRNVIKNEKDDSSKVKDLNKLSKKYWQKGLNDSSLLYGQQALVLSKSIDYKPGVIGAINNIGVAQWRKGNNYEAFDLFTQELDLAKNAGDKKSLISAYGNLGIICISQSNYPEALKYLLQSLKYTEEIGDKKVLATSYRNIAGIYVGIASYDEALNYTFKGLKIDEENKDEEGQASAYANLGVIYMYQGKYDESIKYDSLAIKIYRKMNDKEGIAGQYNNIGGVYQSEKKPAEALSYFIKALKYKEEIGDKDGIATGYINAGLSYTDLKNFSEAAEYLKKGSQVALEIGNKEWIRNSYSGLVGLDTDKGDYRSAFGDYKRYIVYRDSMVNEDNTKKMVKEQMNYDFEKKQAVQKAEQDKKDAIAEQQRNKQKLIRNSFIIGFALMLALAFLIFRGYSQKRRDNIIITKQKEEVEKQKDIAEQQKALVEQQKDLVEEKNKEILDSITYAKRLQDAILPPLTLVKQFLPDSFVLYKPKDIVAGDFYWMERAGNNILIAAADCTGHGVPGALVSVVCSNALNRTVKEFKIIEPGKILDKVRELVLETFEKSESNVQDGMDISLASLTPSERGIQLSWSGAYNSLWFVENGEIKEVPADKQPIGKSDNPKPFKTHTIILNPPSEGREAAMLYLFTDGYADQFGGPKGKKFKYKQLQEKLLAISRQSMEEQKKMLDETLEEWKGNLEQVDDVLLIGIRV